MTLWSNDALLDLERIREFYAEFNPSYGTKILRFLASSTLQAEVFPEVGKRLNQYAPRNVRRLVVGDFELRYEVKDDQLLVLRVWHCKEDR